MNPYAQLIVGNTSHVHAIPVVVKQTPPMCRKGDLCKNGCGKPVRVWKSRRLRVCEDCDRVAKAAYKVEYRKRGNKDVQKT